MTNNNNNNNIKDIFQDMDKILFSIPNTKTYSGNFLAFLNTLKHKDSDGVEFDIHSDSLGHHYATLSEQFYKSMQFKHKILKNAYGPKTCIELIISFDKRVPFFVNHEEVFNFEAFLNSNFSGIYQFLDYNKNEENKKNLISFQFRACASDSEDSVYKSLKYSRIKKITNLEELLLFYKAYMDSLFVHDNYESDLKDLFLVIQYSNKINFK